MNNKIFLICVTFALLAGLAAVGCAAPATTPSSSVPAPVSLPSPTPESQKPIQLVFSTFTPAISADTDTCQKWINEVETRTKGRVKFTFYSAEALGKSVDHYDMAIKGIADVVFYNFALGSGRCPLSESMQLPFVFPSSDASSKVYAQLYHEFPELQKELSQVKVIGLAGTANMRIHTTKKAGAIHTLEDLKGKKIRTSSIENETIEALGAIPTGIVVTEQYLALQKGIVDGISMSFQGIKSWKLSEVLYYYTLWQGPGVRILPFGIFMNLNSWNKPSF